MLVLCFGYKIIWYVLFFYVFMNYVFIFIEFKYLFVFFIESFYFFLMGNFILGIDVFMLFRKVL